MTTHDDIDPPQSGSGLFKATTQPSLDEIKALAIRVLQGPASKTEQVLAAAFLDARRQVERADARTREFMASADPWPTLDVLRKLAEAAEHLLHAHNCDVLGWEQIEGAARRARERIARWEASI